MIIVGERITSTRAPIHQAQEDARMMANVLTARLLLGQDPGGNAYLNAYRQRRLNLDPATPAATARA